MAGDYTIWHNPKCSTSRFVLGALRDAGVAPVVRDYQQDPPSVAELRAAVAAMGGTPRDLLRRKDAPDDVRALDGDALLEALSREPRLIERPLVFSPQGTRLARPKETVFQLLPPGSAD